MLVKIVILIITRWNHNLNYDCIIGRRCHKYQFCCDKYVFLSTNTWHVFVTTKYVFCRDKSTLVMTKLWLSQQNILVIFWSYMSRQNTSFVETKLCMYHFCCNKTFVMTKLSPQTFCHDEHTFVTTKDVFCHNKNYTCGSSRQRQ